MKFCIEVPETPKKGSGTGPPLRYCWTTLTPNSHGGGLKGPPHETLLNNSTLGWNSFMKLLDFSYFELRIKKMLLNAAFCYCSCCSCSIIMKGIGESEYFRIWKTVSCWKYIQFSNFYIRKHYFYQSNDHF